MQNKVEISIILVHYKNIHDTLKCLGSIYLYEPDLNCEVIVIDNHPISNDGAIIKESFPFVRYYQMAYNSGFGRANNYGVQYALGDYLIFLNNDTEITNQAITRALETYNSFNRIGLLTCRIIERDSSNVQYSAFQHFPSIKKYVNANFLKILLTRKKNSVGLQSKEALDSINGKSGYVTWVTGAFMICAKNIFNSVNGFDDDYFMYSEDVDLCYRLNKLGYKHYLNTDAVISHGIGKSFDLNTERTMQILASEFLFVRKTRGAFYFILIFFILKINYSSDYIIAMIRKTKLPLNQIIQNKLSSQYFFPILFYSFRKNAEHNYFKVY
ncbi:MAG: glycosyltransferase [Bacteroidales bacterium]|nr:glycosyltransferase [Bacteroidales bacterium]